MLVEYRPESREIIINKDPNKLDTFVLNFCALLKENYVIVSRYVSILFGRTRATEGIGILMPSMGFQAFAELWTKLEQHGFWCVNTHDLREAYALWQDHAVRFAQGQNPVPNIEFKMIKNVLDNYSYTYRIRARLQSSVLYISPLELQIAYKLFLGSDKDFEDARHLYQLFKQQINKEELLTFMNRLNVSDKAGILEL